MPLFIAYIVYGQFEEKFNIITRSWKTVALYSACTASDVRLYRLEVVVERHFDSLFIP